jgi:hypothetical protein
MKIKDRIIEFTRVKASDLAPDPRNWRTHPQKQKDAMKGILSEIGYADAVLARKLPDGTLMLIDGHLRAETTPNQEIPVLVLDVNEKEAAYILATHDPVSAMAGQNAEYLDAVLRYVDSGNAAVQEMLGELYNKQMHNIEPPESFNEIDENISTDHTCPKCGYAWSGGE